MIVSVNIAWPVELPLPFVDFSGMPKQSNLVSELGHGRFARRQRSRTVYQELPVSFIFTSLQMNEFRTFYITTIYNGAATFSIELRYPKNSALTEWQVRFLGSIRSTYLEGTWRVEAILCLLQPTTVVEPRDPTDPEFGGDEDEEYIQLEQPPSLDCPGGSVVAFGSSYVWGFLADSDPNTEISADTRGKYVTLFTNERDIAYPPISNSAYSAMYWEYTGATQNKLSASHKVGSGNFDPEDPEGDHNATFAGYWTIGQLICIST